MEGLERAILADLQIPDPYAPDSEVSDSDVEAIAARSRGDQRAWEAV
jgi:hypothetical protein